MNRRQALAVLALAVVAGGCSSGPRALVAGEDSCGYCRMTIDDVRFGAMVITSKGRVLTFDSVECLASYVSALSASETPRGVYVANHEHPAQWVDAARATYLHQSQLRSPMGRELAAFPREADRDALVKRYGGKTLAWNDVLDLVKSSGSVAPSHGSHGSHGVHGASAASSLAARSYGARTH